jgi:hypothetical protein
MTNAGRSRTVLTAGLAGTRVAVNVRGATLTLRFAMLADERVR